MRKQEFCECGGRMFLIGDGVRCSRCSKGWPWFVRKAPARPMRKTPAIRLCRVRTNPALGSLCLDCAAMRAKAEGRTR